MTPTEDPAGVVIRNVSKEFRRPGRAPVLAISEASLTVRKGEFVSILGPSGCGKSTLLRMVADIIKPSGGAITIEGRTPEVVRKERKIGFVFQDPALLPWRSVFYNVYVPLEVIAQASVAERKARVSEALELVGLTKFSGAYPHELSGGMRQRVSIARALVTEPQVLLMDEPFGALDEFTRNYLNDELLKVWERTGGTILFVTHSIAEAAYLADRVTLMTPHPGRIESSVDVELPRPRTEELRTESTFTETERRLRAALYHGASRSTEEARSHDGEQPG